MDRHRERGRRLRRRNSGKSAEIGTPLVPQSRLESILLVAVDSGFFGLIFLLPFVMGGREGSGNFALVVLAAWTAIAWAAFQLVRAELAWNHTRAQWLLLTAIVLVALQLPELPAAVHQIVSPQTGQLLPHWASVRVMPETAGDWTRISLTPAQTWRGLMVLLAYCLIFVTAVQRMRCTEDAFRFLRCIGAAAAMMSAFALIQYFTSNGKFFWFYEQPHTTPDDYVKGAFTNRNHFAHFLALGTGPLLWCLVAATRSGTNSSWRSADPRYILLTVAALPLTVCAALSSLSRGGIIAILAAGLAFLLCTVRGSIISARTLTALCAAGILTAGALFFIDESAIQNRIEGLLSADLDKLDTSGFRQTIWAANIAAIRDFPLAGTGIGSHRAVYPVYLESFPGFESAVFSHAENGYLQTALEAGVTGTGLVLAGFGIGIFWCLGGLRNSSQPRMTAAFASVLAAIAASLLHSTVDFVWYAPACVVVVVLLLACACRLRHLIETVTIPPSSREIPFAPVRVVWLCTVMAAGSLMIGEMRRPLMAQPHWHDYLHVSLSDRDTDSPNDPATTQLQKRLLALRATVRADPHHADAHLRLAKAYVAAFNTLQLRSDVPMALYSIREVAETGGFSSPDELQSWLGRILGDRRQYLTRALHHTRRALRQSPLLGTGYGLLSELLFLENAPVERTQLCLEQAMLARPFDPQVLFAAFKEEVRKNNVAEAVQLFQAAFNRKKSFQRRVIDVMVTRVPAATLIELSRPNVAGLEYMAETYRRHGRKDELPVILTSTGQACRKLARDETGDTAAGLCLKAHTAFAEAGDEREADAAIRAAFKAQPDYFESRYTFGRWLLSQEHYAEAARHLTWCSGQRADSRYIQELAKRATRMSARTKKRQASAQFQP